VGRGACKNARARPDSRLVCVCVCVCKCIHLMVCNPKKMEHLARCVCVRACVARRESDCLFFPRHLSRISTFEASDIPAFFSQPSPPLPQFLACASFRYCVGDKKSPEVTLSSFAHELHTFYPFFFSSFPPSSPPSPSPSPSPSSSASSPLSLLSSTSSMTPNSID